MKKYWINTFVVICLCVAIATVFAKTQIYKGTQWEYAYYLTMGETLPDIWHTPDQRFSQFEGKATELWVKCGFKKPENKEALIPDWFNYLGEQGWELVCAKTNKLGDSYWFKRPKK